MSIASLDFCLKVSSDPSNISNVVGGSCNNIPVILGALLGYNEATFGYNRSPSCCWWSVRWSLGMAEDEDDAGNEFLN